MPRVCTVCTHTQRGTIETRILAGESLRDLSALFRVSEDALARHRDNHIPATMAQAQSAATVAQADSLLEQVKQLQVKALKILKDAEDAGDLRAAVGAIREARGNIELLAKLTNELPAQPTYNILALSAEQTIILQALERYPAARLAVVEALDAAK